MLMIDTLGVLTIDMGNLEIPRLENKMVCAIPFAKLQKIWAVIWGDAVSTLFSLFSRFGYIL